MNLSNTLEGYRNEITNVHILRAENEKLKKENLHL